ncbi:transcription factor SPT20 homolog [Prorops nasuta]|uniref:transcription factor SPT20 homolog n=1 Tax=Prorops nasuta TaxID=863751 RepID=UPI0034CF1A87
MEKEQPDSLATVAVVSEKVPQTHSHYAPSEVYSTTEPPPAYMRPPMRSTAVQIARIAAITLITMTVVLGSFILASSYVQARFSCSPESIAAMQADLKLQQQHAADNFQQQNEFLKHLQPEALVQDSVEPKDNLQNLSESPVSKKDVEADTKDIKIQKEDESSKSDNENSERDEEEDDYEDDEFPPVHIKLPLQFDLDDIAGTLMQQSRGRVSCVVERRRADQVMDGSNDNSVNNSTDPQRIQRLSGERVAILCESGNPSQEQNEQDTLTPIIVPLGTVQIPLQQQDQNTNYNHYQVNNNNQYQVPDMQQLPLSDPRGLNHIPAGLLPPELRNLPQLNMEMRPPRMGPQVEIRQIPIELRQFPMDPLRNMRPPGLQDPRQEPQIQMMIQQNEQPQRGYGQEQQLGPMVPQVPQREPQIHEQRVVPQMIIAPQSEERPPVPPQPNQERSRSPFQELPLEIRKIIQQVPLKIKNIIQHITGEATIFPIPEGARREAVHEFKPFPEGARPIPLGPFPLPIEVKNLLEHGNIEGRQRSDRSEERQEAKPFPGPEDQGEEAERNFPVPAEIRDIIHQVVEGRAFAIPRFALPLRPVDTLEVPVEARAEVSDSQSNEQQNEQRQQEQQQQQQPTHLIIQEQQEQQSQEHEEENRPHYVQPRSIRSIPEPFAAHKREKRVRRCSCDCAC